MFTITIIGALACLAVAYAIGFIGRRDSKLPPGPPTLPIIGNLHQVPTKRTHLKFTEWAQKYGGIFSLKFGPATTIVITSPRLVKQLIDKKSSIYSHRPASFIGYNLISDGDHLLLMQYSDHWRKCRKLVHQFLMENMVVKHHLPLIEGEAVQMVNDLMTDPAHHMKHPKRFSNSIIMSLVYGTRTPNINTDHMVRLYALMEDWSKVMEPGNTPPVDIFPFLKYIPEQFMGNWRSRGQDVGDKMNRLYDEWLTRVMNRREVSGSKDCFLDRLLDQKDSGKLEMSNHAIYFLCGTLMEGGSDTTSSIIIAFMHALTKWPEVQKRAQKQIDDVVGEDRSPTWEDYTKLPYVAACVKEVMRWRPVVPLGFPHVLSEDDTVGDMVLPKGSQIFINAFGMQHDPARFENPDEFNPGHYEGVTELASELANGDWEKRDHYGYGSGRRICPGIHVAERSLFLAMAKLLWALNIDPAISSTGQAIDPDVSNEKAYSAGFLVCAESFPCNISVRSEARRKTLERELSVAQAQIFSQFE